MYDKMAVIGDKDSIFAFKSVGAEVYGTNNPLQARDYVKMLAKNGTKLIFITEDLAAQMEDVLQKYKSKTYPTIIPIPKQGKTTGYGMKGLKKDMEKAIGADILFRE